MHFLKACIEPHVMLMWLKNHFVFTLHMKKFVQSNTVYLQLTNLTFFALFTLVNKYHNLITTLLCPVIWLYLAFHILVKYTAINFWLQMVTKQALCRWYDSEIQSLSLRFASLLIFYWLKMLSDGIYGDILGNVKI